MLDGVLMQKPAAPGLRDLTNAVHVVHDAVLTVLLSPKRHLVRLTHAARLGHVGHTRWVATFLKKVVNREPLVMKRGVMIWTMRLSGEWG